MYEAVSKISSSKNGLQMYKENVLAMLPFFKKIIYLTFLVEFLFYALHNTANPEWE